MERRVEGRGWGRCGCCLPQPLTLTASDGPGHQEVNGTRQTASLPTPSLYPSSSRWLQYSRSVPILFSFPRSIHILFKRCTRIIICIRCSWLHSHFNPVDTVFISTNNTFSFFFNLSFSKYCPRIATCTLNKLFVELALLL